MENLLNTHVGPNSIMKDSLPPAWKESVEFIQSLQLPPESREVVIGEGNVPTLLALAT